MSRRRWRLDPAVRGFDRAAETYERGRPDYPEAAVRYLDRQLRLGAGRTVVELGSGTGKLTRSLLPLGAAVVAVEPTAGMRRVFRRAVPSVVVLDGVAERIPLPDGFADGVVAAQAFQWFRTGPALREIARVLRPGGRLALVWNVRDGSTGVSRRLSELLDRYGAISHPARHDRWRAAFGGAQGRFGPLRRRSFPHVQRATPETLVQRVLSESAVAVLSPPERQRVAREARRILADDPSTDGRSRVRFPYRTDVYVTGRADRRR
jgi:SAM-dependent methyltransferase